MSGRQDGKAVFQNRYLGSDQISQLVSLAQFPLSQNLSTLLREIELKIPYYFQSQ